MPLTSKSYQRGSAIVIVLSIVGIIGVISAGLVSFLTNSDTVNAKIAAKISFSDKIKQIRLLTNDIDGCTNLIRGTIFNTAVDSKNPLLSLNFGLSLGKNFVTGQKIPDIQAQLLNIFLIPTATPIASYLRFPIQIVPGYPNPYAVQKLKAKIIFELDSKLIWNGYLPEHAIEIYVRYIMIAPTRAMAISCNSAVSPAEACDVAMNIPHATKSWGWSPTDRNNLELWSCQPNQSCLTRDSSNVADPSTCIPPFLPRLIGSSGGNKYLCMWCNPRPYPPL